ncbi:hypothetical protein [Pseudarthrobacter oxydans]|uniref:hypothetical protein n=1 Tax=Pseudarthrobacter oxydans TaxID=1671 RepID=UPI0035E70349|nr:hypothetical protein GCM10017547_38570 [Pseudarthrobacter oxydans]
MKRSLLISGLLATVVTTFGLSGVSSSELDLPGLNQRIDNIDARTTNNEADIQALQQSTGTAPAEHVVVPAAPTSTTTSTSTSTATAPTIQPAAAQATPAPATPVATPVPTPVPCFPTPAPNQANGISVIVYQPEGCR